ncbi:MAG: glutamine-hydrolyzing carbamoyl-phosphate synthase small subunit [Alphaproteobacteria bacterium]|nr:glutamine-hydrolyzing carbamoyl-phosphate synthase small subunit [Alphaproteobacteria bacterium]
MKPPARPKEWTEEEVATGVLVLADGTVFEGKGLGSIGAKVGEVCFNTAMTGYQEILTDPSYASQIIAFTFPHIGNVGTNAEDDEAMNIAACGAVFKADITAPSNYRNTGHLDQWLKRRGLIAICGIDTRALTVRIREAGMPHGVIAHDPAGRFDRVALQREAAQWRGLEGLDLAKEVSCTQTYASDQTRWHWGEGFGRLDNPLFHVVAMDFGIKRNILRALSDIGAKVTVVPASASAETILALNPDGVFLSNGPGDPAATGAYAVPVIQTLIASGKPVFGICLGHQMLGLAAGGRTAKMHQGHHGANHPVKDKTTGKVEIVSMNHGFTVDKASLPANVVETHVSLFDGTNCGIAWLDRPVFGVQYHPEASPGPQDSHYLFERFAQAMRKAR